MNNLQSSVNICGMSFCRNTYPINNCIVPSNAFFTSQPMFSIPFPNQMVAQNQAILPNAMSFANPSQTAFPSSKKNIKQNISKKTTKTSKKPKDEESQKSEPKCIRRKFSP